MKKVIFLGGKKVGYLCLEALIQHPGIHVLQAISNCSDLYDASDRWYPCIRELAEKNNLPYKATNKINASDMIQKIRKLAPDIIFVAYYDQILSPSLFSIPKEGAVNLHLADAEKYRGCYPTVYAIINGEKEYGVTLHYIDEGVDTGYIIDKVTFPLLSTWTGKDLYEVATLEGVKLFERNLDAFVRGKVKARPQASAVGVKQYRRKQFPSHEISFSEDPERIYNKIRSLLFPPFPPPYFMIGEKKIVIQEYKQYDTSG